MSPDIIPQLFGLFFCMKYYLGRSAVKVTVLFGVITVLLTGCFTGRDDYRDTDREYDHDRDHYDHHDDMDHHEGEDRP